MIKDYPNPAENEASESQKIYCMISKYVDGKKGLDIGCGGWKMIGSTGIDIRPGAADIIGDITKGLRYVLGQKKGRGRLKKFDYIFSSHLLEDFEEPVQEWLIEDWVRHLKPGGHLILYVPERGKYLGVNQAHKHEFSPPELRELITIKGLTVVDFFIESIVRQGAYSIVAVGQKQ